MEGTPIVGFQWVVLLFAETSLIARRPSFSRVDDAMLQHIFSDYGNIVNCKVLRQGSGLSKGVAFVKFSTVAEARHAVSHIQGSRPFGAVGLMARFVETTDARALRQARYPRSSVPPRYPVAVGHPVVAAFSALPQLMPVYQQSMYYQPVYCPNHPGMYAAPAPQFLLYPRQ